MYKLPDFIIVGAAKSGTTSLFLYLTEHPQIYEPILKEPYFFCFYNKEVNFKTNAKIIRDLNSYISLFSSASKNQIIGEATPYYLYFYKETINNIREIYTKYNQKPPKIIITLRNPIDRAFSQYLMHVRDNQEPLSFDEAIKPEIIFYRLKYGWNPGYDYIGFGKYYNQVKAYLDNFEEVEIILYEDFKKDPFKVINNLYRFLNVDSDYIPSRIGIKYNVSGIPKNRIIYNILNNENILKAFLKKLLPIYFIKYLKIIKEKMNEKLLDKQKLTISKEAKDYLLNVYKEDIIKLQRLINRDLSHWLENK